MDWFIISINESSLGLKLSLHILRRGTTAIVLSISKDLVTTFPTSVESFIARIVFRLWVTGLACPGRCTRLDGWRWRTVKNRHQRLNSNGCTFGLLSKWDNMNCEIKYCLQHTVFQVSTIRNAHCWLHWKGNVPYYYLHNSYCWAISCLNMWVYFILRVYRVFRNRDQWPCVYLAYIMCKHTWAVVYIIDK